MIDFDSDLQEMFDVDEFGTVVTLPDSSSITAIFDNVSIHIDDGLNVISTREPILTCLTDDIQSLNKNDVIVVNSTNYTVTDFKHDGTGITELILKK